MLIHSDGVWVDSGHFVFGRPRNDLIELESKKTQGWCSEVGERMGKTRGRMGLIIEKWEV